MSRCPGQERVSGTGKTGNSWKCQNSPDNIDCYQGRAWSEDACECGCPLASITGCGPGLAFDHNSTCACVPLPGLAAAGQSDGGQLSELSDPEAGLSWEVIIIISLGSLLLILSAIVLGLLVRLTAIRRAAGTKPRLVPSTLSGQYFPCADPCTDISLSRPATKVTLSFIKTSGSSLNLQKRGLGAESDSDSDRGKMLTDSSLCSDQVAHVILLIIVMRSFLRSGMLSGQTAASLCTSSSPR